MISPDVQLLLYAYNSRSPFHQSARAYLEAILSGSEPIGIPVQCIHAFVRIITNPAVSDEIDLEAAFAIVNQWLSLPHVSVLQPGSRNWSLLQTLAKQGHAIGKIFSDAAIAATAVEYGSVIHTHDRDFARFPGLRWHDPLA